MKIELTLSQQSLQVAPEAKVIFLVRLAPDTQKKVDPPIDARFVLDRSGSMAEETHGGMAKIDALRKAVSPLFGNILRTGKDRIFVIVYDDTMQVLVDSSVLDDPVAVRRAIDGMTTGGSTHLSSPLAQALDVAAHGDFLPKVIIFTDGEVNAPSVASEEKACLKLAREARQKRIPLAVFGTGVQYNERFLKQLAEAAGNGSYFEHVSQVGTMGIRLADDFEQLKSIQERDVEVVVEAGVDAVILEATKYVPQQQDLQTDGKTARDAFPGLEARGQSYLVKTHIKSREMLGDFQVATVTVSWTGAAGRETKTVPVVVNFSVDAPVDPTVFKTVLNTEGVKATLAGRIGHAKTLFTEADNQEMVEKLDTLAKQGEDAKRTLRTEAVTKAHQGTIIDKNEKGGTR